MNDERLGMAAGAWLRGIDRPSTERPNTIAAVMAEVHSTRQVRRRWGWRAGGDRIAITAQAKGTRSMISATKLISVGVGALLVGAVIASGVLTPTDPVAPGATGPASPESQGPTGSQAIGWTTNRVALTADAMRLEANDLVFGSDVWPISVNSSPGSSESWTLEIVWIEHDREQRLNLYFGSDGIDWWVDEVRTYDGYDPGEWVYAYGPFFQTPLEETFQGDVQLDLVGEGRPEDGANLVPAVLTFDGLRLGVSPGADPLPGMGDPTAETGEDDDGPVAVPMDAIDEQCGSEGEFETQEAVTLCRALFTAFEPSQGEAPCHSVENARAIAEGVVAALGLSGWSIESSSHVREDGCAAAYVGDEGMITIVTGMHPDVRAVLEEFRVLSMEECFDEATAVDMLTERLEGIGHQDFVVAVDSTLGGPSDEWEAIQAHSEAGCVFYVVSGGDADGNAVYTLHG